MQISKFAVQLVVRRQFGVFVISSRQNPNSYENRIEWISITRKSQVGRWWWAKKMKLIFVETESLNIL